MESLPWVSMGQREMDEKVAVTNRPVHTSATCCRGFNLRVIPATNTERVLLGFLMSVHFFFSCSTFN